MSTASGATQDAARAQFQTLKDEPSPGGGEVNLDVILDVFVTLSMEVGRAKVPIRNLLHGTLIAHGEVVVVNEKFGIRLTDVVSPSERIRKLK